jgi:transcriptional regulator with XRE-family HTH domain
LTGPITQEPIHRRLRAVREATGLTQLQFLPLLNSCAVDLEIKAYSQSTLSKLETGTQAATFDDVAAFAAADPQRRGKLWLAWGESKDATMVQPRRHGPSVIQQPRDEHLNHAIGGTKKQAPRKRA